MPLRESVLATIEQTAPAPVEIATPLGVVVQQAELGPSQSIWSPLADMCENAVLVACTQSAEYAQVAAGQLQVSDFDLAWRQEIWRAMVTLLDRGQRPVLTALLGRVRWLAYDRLVDAITHTPNPYTYDYLGTVKAGGDYRRMLATAGETIAREAAV